MGFIKQAKAESMAKDAARAAAEGHTVFVVQLQMSVGMSNSLSRVVTDAAEMIEAIEAEGWHLDQMSYVPRDHKTPEGIYLFRKGADVTPVP